VVVSPAHRTKGKCGHYDVQSSAGRSLPRLQHLPIWVRRGQNLLVANAVRRIATCLAGTGTHVITGDRLLGPPRLRSGFCRSVQTPRGVGPRTIQTTWNPATRRHALRLRHHKATGLPAEFGFFDYSRRQHKPPRPTDDEVHPYWRQVPADPPLHYCLIDEVDNILIDESPDAALHQSSAPALTRTSRTTRSPTRSPASLPSLERKGRNDLTAGRHGSCSQATRVTDLRWLAPA